MDLLGVVAIDAGLFCVFLGLISLFKPLRLIGIKTRTAALIVILSGFVAIVLGMNLPVRETRVPVATTKLDELVPVYQFHEVHTTVVEAPPARVYEAMKAVEPNEILAYRTLTWMRRFGKQNKPNILNPPDQEPLLQTALRTGFLPLSDDPGREFVFGFAGSPLLVSKPTAENFKALDGPFLAKVAMNFRVDPIDANHCTLTTETRIYGSDRDVQQLFAPYWRLIYPGSSLIRRMWLRAIRKRAEAASAVPANLALLFKAAWA